MEAAQNYIQGRFDLYSHLFRELSPPIPNECKRMFSINGCLAPGYTLAPPDKEEPDKQAVDDLLACLDDSDTAAPSEIQKSPDKPVEKNSNGKSKSAVKINQLAHQANARGAATGDEITEALRLVQQTARLVRERL